MLLSRLRRIDRWIQLRGQIWICDLAIGVQNTPFRGFPWRCIKDSKKNRHSESERQRQLKDALSKALTWLAEDPPPLPRPPPKVPTPGANHTAPTAHLTPHRRTAITTIPCLQTTCQTRSNPPPQKSHAPTKTKCPCAPNNHPRNAPGTLKTLHHAKHVVTPTPLNRWHPPNPPALTVPTDGLQISSELQPPPPASGRTAPISEFNIGVFFMPPHRLPYPPSTFGLFSAKHRVNPVLTSQYF